MSDGVIYERDLDNGFVHVVPLTYGRARIGFGTVRGFYDAVW